ncbi:hypothetical protein JTE90_017503 [Oedothorax gibbosus]|uniref:Methionine aminopeptidase n=1 Tax=Oedothorax gibbosus TaxID=931172 RepID=A0AAV6UAS8_9ARAC|nr:hypothetical protein JTE90_017503 [Oedothorax gibbosus]
MALHLTSKNICRTVYNKHTLLTSNAKSFINPLQSIKSNEQLRGYSRRRSWFKAKKPAYDIVDLCEVGTRRSVPEFVPKPPYAATGIENEPESQIQILDAESVRCMRNSCSLAKILLDEVARHIKLGVTTDELDAIAHSTCINFGAYPSPLNYRGFPKSICTSVNNIACHGIPDSRKLKKGDIISVDISVFYNGFHGDCASTYFVNQPDPMAQKLVEVAQLCLLEGIKVCHHGQKFCAIGNTISNLAKSQGFSVIPAFCGHGISSSFHCSPNILHYENEEPGIMQKGMIFTIEPVICEGAPDIVILEDGWTASTEDNSRSAQFEHTILITEEGAEILTVPDKFKPQNS